jgi:hypothetical protein
LSVWSVMVIVLQLSKDNSLKTWCSLCKSVMLCTYLQLITGLLLSKKVGLRFGFIVFNTTFNNISVLSWRSVLLVEETGVPRVMVIVLQLSKDNSLKTWCSLCKSVMLCNYLQLITISL